MFKFCGMSSEPACVSKLVFQRTIDDSEFHGEMMRAMHVLHNYVL